MYPKNNLYKIYREYYLNPNFSRRLPDITKRFTLDNINKAINCCEHWRTFLDIGAGSGHYSAPLLHKFKKGVAVEPSQNAQLNKLRDEMPTLTVKNDFIQHLSFDDTFDFILMADLFEHIPPVDLDNFLDHVSGLQAKGGVVYLLTPNVFFCGPAEESGIFHTRHANGHYKHYTSSEISALFLARGYELLALNYEEHSWRRAVEAISWSLSRRDKKLVANELLGWLSWPLVALIGVGLKALGYIAFCREAALANAADQAVTVSLIFKKIR